ncbi:MAG: hypothetical protein ABI718_10830 [Acidobacteriota bacterium]
MNSSDTADLPPEISVVLAFSGDRAALARCLRAIREPGVRSELIVAYADREAAPTKTNPEFERVRFVESAEGIGRMRAAGIAVATAPLIAITRDDACPAPGWLAHFVRSHDRTDASAIGGPVLVEEDASLTALAAFLSEYSAFTSVSFDANAADLAASNVCYKKSALPFDDIADYGYREMALHERLRAEGRRLQYDPAVPVFLPAREQLLKFALGRFRMSRRFARDRAADTSAMRRSMLALGSPLLPALFIARTSSRAIRNRRGRELLRSLPLIAFFHIVAAGGEALGYLQSVVRPGGGRR